MDTVTDGAGRVIEVQKLTSLERMRLIRACGKAADIEVYLGNAIIAAIARTIDGVPVPRPTSPESVDQLVDRVGDDGVQAIAKWWTENNAPVDAAAAKN